MFISSWHNGTKFVSCLRVRGFLVGAVVKNPPAKAGDSRSMGSIPGSGRSPEAGNGNLIQYFGLGNSMNRKAWRATIHGVNKEPDRRVTEHTHTLS